MFGLTKEKAYVASAPGKVLLAGGYLVLDRKYTGLVFGLSARIHVVVQKNKEDLVTVKSPQFKDAEWRYKVADYLDGKAVDVKQLEDSPAGSTNPFVQAALTYTLSYLSTPLTSGLTLTILADNDYYSNPSSTSTRFADFGVPLSSANKTGLGSSAALTTALCTSLVEFLFPLPTSSSDDDKEARKRQLHNLSQTAHCSAQGKIGSGFDVAAAVYGSCLYRRFSPSLLAELGSSDAYSLVNFRSKLRELVDESGDVKWDQECGKSVALPKGYSLVMADVDCGSATVGMVKEVLGWREKEKEEAQRIWEALQSANEGLAAVLAAGSEINIREGLRNVRKLIREMGAKSGVPIEPESQSRLLDALEGLEGVVGGVVPGAGGFDALALLVRDDEETKERLVTFLEELSAKGQGRVRLLRVKGEMEGVREEQVKDYAEWLNL